MYSLDRIAYRGNCEPNNCRIVDDITQARNKSNNVFLDVNEQSKCIAEWAEISGVRRSTIAGWVRNHGVLYAECRIKETIEEGFRNYGHVYLTTNGDTKNLAEWARSIGVCHQVISNWVSISKEYAIQRINEVVNHGIIRHPHPQTKYITIEGETMSHSDWAKKLGVTLQAISRWRRTYGEDEAIRRIVKLLNKSNSNNDE